MARTADCLSEGREFKSPQSRQCSSEGLRALRLGDKASNSRGLDLDKSLNCLVSTAKTNEFAETEIGWI